MWLTWPSPSLLSEWVQACGRLPSTELALVRDAVRERARRVMLAEGTVDREGTQREAQQAGPGTGKREKDSHKQSGQRDLFFQRHKGPIPGQGCGICSVKPKACNSATVREPKVQGPGSVGTNQTLSPQLARATARARLVGVGRVSQSWCKDGSRFQQRLSREDDGAGGVGDFCDGGQAAVASYCPKPHFCPHPEFHKRDSALLNSTGHSGTAGCPFPQGRARLNL